MKIEELATDILNLLEVKFGKKEITVGDMETARLSLGLTLTSIHAAMIHSAQTMEDKKCAVETALDTCQRLLGSIQRDTERCGIDGFTFISSEMPEAHSDEVH